MIERQLSIDEEKLAVLEKLIDTKELRKRVEHFLRGADGDVHAPFIEAEMNKAKSEIVRSYASILNIAWRFKKDGLLFIRLDDGFPKYDDLRCVETFDSRSASTFDAVNRNAIGATSQRSSGVSYVASLCNAIALTPSDLDYVLKLLFEKIVERIETRKSNTIQLPNNLEIAFSSGSFIVRERGIYVILGMHISRYAYQLSDTCMDLHGSCCGTIDLLQPSLALKLYYFLGERLNDWNKSTKATRSFDEAVRKLCFEARREYEKKWLKIDLEEYEKTMNEK